MRAVMYTTEEGGRWEFFSENPDIPDSEKEIVTWCIDQDFHSIITQQGMRLDIINGFTSQALNLEGLMAQT